MASPKSLPLRLVPRGQSRGARLPDTVATNHDNHQKLVQFLQQNFQDHQTAITDQNGQKLGGIVLAQHLPSRTHLYQMTAAVFPHVGDLPTQPSAVTYDGPLNFTKDTLPTGVNTQFAYARWTGYINPPTPAMYSFHLVTTGGGANLFVNQQQLVGMLPSPTGIAETGQAQLGNGAVPIVVEYQYGAGDPPALSLSYSTPATPMALVPNTWLSNSINQMSGFLVGYWTNGSQVSWHP